MTATRPETMYWMLFRDEYLVKNPETGKKEWREDTPERDRVIKSYEKWLKEF